MTEHGVGVKRRRTGRWLSPVWSYFTKIRMPNSKLHASCNFCGKRCAAVASRMQLHVENKCEKAPTDISQLLNEAIASRAKVEAKPEATIVSTDVTSSIGATDSDPDTIPIQASPDASDPNPAKRQKQQQPIKEAEQVQPSVVGEIRVETQEGAEASEVEEEEEPEVVEEAEIMETAVVGQVLTGYTEQEANAVHQKLVLACVLNDVPAFFVEDEALMEAFDAARPGLPRLSAELAKTIVLQELAAVAAKKMEGELARCEVLTLVHRHFKMRGETGGLPKWCNRWVGVDEHRKMIPLKETYKEVDSSTLSTDEDFCRHCPSRNEFDAMTANYRLRVGPETIFSFCAECPQAYLQLRLEQQQALLAPARDTDGAMAAQILLSTCLLRQSLIIRKKLLDTFPSVLDLLKKAVLLGHSVAKSTPLRPQLEDLLSSSSWDSVPRLVKRMIYLEGDVRRYQAKVSVPAEGVSSFWNKLRVGDKLLTPLNWMLVLSEAKETTSAQCIVLWLWLLAVVHSTDSQMLPDQDKERFTATVMSVIGCYVDSHQLVCMLLDPRIAGAGLSISGKRRVKSLVVQVAERVFPREGYSSGVARSQLLTQLGDYTEKSDIFADVVAWEMSAGRPPRLFWNDFIEDASHLTRVANAVISVTPFAQTASQALNPAVPTGDFVWAQTFAVRQLKFQSEQKPTRGSGVEKYQSLLFLPAPSAQGSAYFGSTSIEADRGRVNSSLRWSASDETQVDAIITQKMSSLLRIGDDTDPATTRLTSTAASRANHQRLGASWFVFHSANDRKVLEQAVKRFLPSVTTII